MPELPEVETMCRGIRDIVGGTIAAIRFPPCACKPLLIRPSEAVIKRRLIGQSVAQVYRLGKRVVIETLNSDSLVFEPRMTGLVSLGDLPDQEHLRLELEVRRGRRTICVLIWDRRGLGTLSLYDRTQLHQAVISQLGPDALQIEVAELRARFESSRQAIKVALLDQKRIAGIGNLYASEILHLARIGPQRAAASLSVEEWHRLHESMREVLALAIQYEGSTLSDGTYRNALNQSGGYQNHHRVYGKAGETCPSCRRGQVLRSVQAQRSTFYCPVCQPEAAALLKTPDSIRQHRSRPTRSRANRSGSI